MRTDTPKDRQGTELKYLCAIVTLRCPSVSRADSAFGADFASRRTANLITLCDGRGVDFVTIAEYIPIAAHDLAWRARKRYCYSGIARARIAVWVMRAAVTILTVS
jgi:hypothetical protein